MWHMLDTQQYLLNEKTEGGKAQEQQSQDEKAGLFTPNPMFFH